MNDAFVDRFTSRDFYVNLTKPDPTMLKCLIVDDDIHCRNILKSMLEAEFRNVLDVSHSATCVHDALRLLHDIRPDIVFLDVELEDGTGFDVLEKTTHRDFKFIFTTAYDSYAIQAFKVNAADYLLKPFSPTELKEAVQRVTRQPLFSYMGPEMQLLLDHINGNRSRIALPTQGGYEFVNVAEIIRCSAESNYTRFYLKDGKSHLVSKTLRVYENLLEPDGFCRVHASHLINLKEVKSYQKGEGGYAVMTDGSSVEISRTKRDAFLSRIRI